MTRTQTTIAADAGARSEHGAARRTWKEVRWARILVLLFLLFAWQAVTSLGLVSPRVLASPTTEISLVSLGTFFPVYLNTYAGIRSVDNKLVDAATTLGLGRTGLVAHVVLPGALPNAPRARPRAWTTEALFAWQAPRRRTG
ncbi:ABC transporter permease subunit [Sorangium sp. So ce861]